MNDLYRGSNKIDMGLENLSVRTLGRLDEVVPADDDLIPVLDISTGMLKVSKTSDLARGGLTTHSGTLTVVVALQDNTGVEYKTVDLTITNGLITEVSAESEWTVIPTA